jgi:hypothetical protein
MVLFTTRKGTIDPSPKYISVHQEGHHRSISKIDHTRKVKKALLIQPYIIYHIYMVELTRLALIRVVLLAMDRDPSC